MHAQTHMLVQMQLNIQTDAHTHIGVNTWVLHLVDAVVMHRLAHTVTHSHTDFTCTLPYRGHRERQPAWLGAAPPPSSISFPLWQ